MFCSLLKRNLDETQQVLRYEPVPAPGCAVDPLSAILSLPADERDDPRVAGEIENVLTRVLGGDHEGNR